MFGGCGSTLGSLSLRFSAFTQIDQSDRMYEQLQWRGASLLEGVQESLPGLTSFTLRQRVFSYGSMTLADADFIIMSRCLPTCPGTVAPVDLAASLLTPKLILDWISNAPSRSNRDSPITTCIVALRLVIPARPTSRPLHFCGRCSGRYSGRRTFFSVLLCQ